MSIAEKLTAIAENEQRVFEAGKYKEWSDFWDVFQQNGERTNYERAFHDNPFTDVNFKPKYDIIAKGSFSYAFWGASVTDLAKSLSDQGVVLDTSGATSFDYAFYNCASSTLPVIDTRSADEIHSICMYMPNLVTMELILRDDGSQTFTNQNFSACSNLENLKVTGKIGNTFQYYNGSGKLTVESMVSIIDALVDYGDDTSGTTRLLELNAMNLNRLQADRPEYIAIATEKGWTLK